MYGVLVGDIFTRHLDGIYVYTGYRCASYLQGVILFTGFWGGLYLQGICVSYLHGVCVFNIYRVSELVILYTVSVCFIFTGYYRVSYYLQGIGVVYIYRVYVCGFHIYRV